MRNLDIPTDLDTTDGSAVDRGNAALGAQDPLN